MVQVTEIIQILMEINIKGHYKEIRPKSIFITIKEKIIKRMLKRFKIKTIIKIILKIIILIRKNKDKITIQIIGRNINMRIYK